MRSFRPRRPGPALVIASLALFVVLGAGAYAVTKAAKNSVVSKSIKKAAVRSADVKDGGIKSVDLADGAVTSAAVKNDDISGDDVDEATLNGGQIAGVDAATVDGKSAVCDAGTRLFHGACWEEAARAPAIVLTASETCSAAGGHLPQTYELRSFAAEPQITLAATDEYTAEINTVTAANTFTAITVSDAQVINLTNQNDAKGYRCVLPLVR